MDTTTTLSTSVSTFKNPIPSLHPIPIISHPRYFKNPQQPHLISSTTKPNKSSKTTTLNPPFPFVNAAPSSQAFKQSSNPHLIHRNPPTGYAVALLDIARHNNAVELVKRDVKRLSKYLRNHQLNGIMTNTCVEKGEILNEIVRKGKFQKHLVKLVNLLVEKNKVEMLSEVLLEFQRIYDELSCNNQMVLVSSGMNENQVLEIAKRVQKLTGAVKVKVRQLLLPQFAV